MSTVDLVAESGAREQHAAALAETLPSTASWPHDWAHGLDRTVFGDWAPRTDPAKRGYPLRYCTVHPGVQWYGTSDCWTCKPGPV